MTMQRKSDSVRISRREATRLLGMGDGLGFVSTLSGAAQVSRIRCSMPARIPKRFLA